MTTSSGSKSKRAKPSPRRVRPPNRLRISIIGAGRLGTALGRALDRAGHRIELAVAKHPGHARRAAKLINRSTLSSNSVPLAQTKRAQHERLLASDVLLISTPDDVLALVAEQLAGVFPKKSPKTSPRRIALHTSGALSSEVLKPLRDVGFAIASLHPLVSVAEPKSNPDIFRDVFFCTEGDRSAVRAARAIVRDLNGHGFTIDARSKTLYHAAAVMSSGHVTALFDLAIEMLEHCGLSPRRAQEVLLPLHESNTANLATKNPAQALTGPFARGDLVTVRNHLASMKSGKLTEALAAYLVLGKRSLGLAADSKPAAERLKQIAKLLSEYRQV